MAFDKFLVGARRRIHGRHSPVPINGLDGRLDNAVDLRDGGQGVGFGGGVWSRILPGSLTCQLPRSSSADCRRRTMKGLVYLRPRGASRPRYSAPRSAVVRRHRLKFNVETRLSATRAFPIRWTVRVALPVRWRAADTPTEVYHRPSSK